MTTREAEAQYLADHLRDHAGRKLAHYNPHDKPIEELPIIFGFNNGGKYGWYSGVLLAEDGTPLGGHICSHEGYMPSDLGVLEGTRPDRHETFREHYPDGYRMQFVSFDDVKGNAKLCAAIKKAEAHDE